MGSTSDLKVLDETLRELKELLENPEKVTDALQMLREYASEMELAAKIQGFEERRRGVAAAWAYFRPDPGVLREFNIERIERSPESERAYVIYFSRPFKSEKYVALGSATTGLVYFGKNTPDSVVAVVPTKDEEFFVAFFGDIAE